MIPLVREAFLSISNGFSPDRVVADPALNDAFVSECRKLNLQAIPKDLNRSLLNLRKMRMLTGHRTLRRTSFPNEDAYRHASEVAVRFLEKREGCTLDEIMCEPELAAEFDTIAASIVAGQQPLHYRWAAINLRKSSKLKPELMSQIVRPTGVILGKLQDVDFSTVPTGQGLYIFYASQQTLYVGEASNLRIRLAKHADHSDNRELARWFWVNGFKEVLLEIQELPASTSKKVRLALEAELINSRHPVFNVQRVSKPK